MEAMTREVSLVVSDHLTKPYWRRGISRRRLGSVLYTSGPMIVVLRRHRGVSKGKRVSEDNYERFAAQM